MSDIDQNSFSLQDLEQEPLFYQGEVNRDRENQYSDADGCHGIGGVSYKPVGSGDYQCDSVNRETLEQSVKRNTTRDMTFTSDNQITCATEEATTNRSLSAVPVGIMRGGGKYNTYTKYEESKIINQNKVLYNRNNTQRPQQTNIDFDDCRDTLFTRGICNVDRFASYTTFIQQDSQEAGVLNLNNALSLLAIEEQFNIKESQLYDGFTIRFLCKQTIQLPQNDNYYTLNLDTQDGSISLTKKLYENSNLLLAPLGKIVAGQLIEIYYTTQLGNEGVFVLVDLQEQLKQSYLDLLCPIGQYYYQKVGMEEPSVKFPNATWELIDTYDGRFEMSSSTQPVGTVIGEELPNISGYMNNLVVYNSMPAGGAFSSGEVNRNWLPSDKEQNCSRYNISFSAHNSNGTYINNGAVRPKTITYKLWRRLS